MKKQFKKYLILEETSTKGPDATEDKVQLIPFLRTVWWCVFWHKHALEQIAQHLQMTDIGYWGNLLEAELHYFQAHWHILVKEDRQISPL